MTNVFHNQTDPNIYSLSEELIKFEDELTVLETKINLGNDLLAKINDQVLISKLEKQKKNFESEKSTLNIKIKKINYINGSIKDFILFFVFIKRFYALAILKQNFENADKKNSLRLIDKLKIEEENLYSEYIDGNCFSKVLLALDFGHYQFYFKEFAKNFFENINYTSDPYINSLLRLKAILFECTHFSEDNFNLIDLNFFLSKNIPISIPVPKSNYELVALRCFFFYELLEVFLKFKPIASHFDDLKKAITLDSSMIDYKANTQSTLISSLNSLKEALQKINNKYDSFLREKPVVDEKSDVNHVLIFYKKLEEEIEIINKKSKSLIDNKYLKLEKMQRLLAIIVNEANFPKFLEVFNRKIGNDFSLNSMENLDVVGTNKEALSYLFHVLCKDKFYTPINEKISSLIKEQTEIYSKEDSFILDSLEFEDLVEFSFYYIFSLLYVDFDASLSGFNTKLSYTEMVALNVFFKNKFQYLEILVTKRKTEIKKFLSKKFKNITEYNLHRRNILEEIKLNLETIHDLNRSLSDIKFLETSLIPKLNDSSIPMPEKDLIFESLKLLEEKQKDCEVEYQRIEKHKFNNKSESEKIAKNKKAEFKKELATKNKLFEVLAATLNCMSENLSESLRHIKKSKQDVNIFFQKISSKKDQVFSEIFKCISNLNNLSNDKTQELKNLNLLELLNMVEKFVVEDTLIKEDLRNKLLELISNFHLLIGNLVDQVNLIINKYHNYISKVKKMLNSFSIQNPSSSFSNSLTRKISSDYMHLKKQSNFLKEIINLFKCNTDEMLELFNIIEKLDVDYQKLNIKKFEKRDKKSLLKPLQPTREDIEKIPEKNFQERQSEKSSPAITKSSLSHDTQTNSSRENNLLTEILKSTDECNKIKARLEGEYASKERAKADLKAITSAGRYNFLISRIDPLNVGIPTTINNVDHNLPSTETSSCLTVPPTLQTDIIETNTNNDSGYDSAVYPSAPVRLFPALPTIVEDTYLLVNRTIFYPI